MGREARKGTGSPGPAWCGTELPPPVYGAAGTLALVVLVEALWRIGGLIVPNLGVFVVSVPSLFAFHGGYRPGLVSALLSLSYYAYYMAEIHSGGYSVERLLTTTLVTLVAVPLVAYLRLGLHNALQRERALRAESDDRLKQQAAVSTLGMQALGGVPVPALRDSAVELLRDTLGVDLVKVHELSDDGETLKLRAGFGWKEGLVGTAEVPARGNSQAAFTLASEAPVIVDDLATETRFEGPAMLLEHGAVSGLSVIIKGNGRPYGVLGVHTRARRVFTVDDVHFVQSVANVLAQTLALRSAHERVKESESRFRDLAENVDDVFWVWDEASGRVVYVNPAYERVWGMSAESLYADPESWIQNVHPDDLPIARSVTEGGGEGMTYELRVLQPDRTVRWVAGRLFRVRRDGQARFVGVTRDITESKRAAETERRLVEAQVARATAEASVQARDETLAVVSHDLRNPLNSIALAAARLSDGWPGPSREDVARPFAAIDRAVRQMSRLTDDLLDVSRIKAGKLALALRPIELGPLIDEAREAHALAAEARSLALTTVVPPGPIVVLADRERVLQVYANLVGNAVKFTPEGGTITLRARPEGDRVVLAVSNDGPGIPPAELPHLFERYWQARERDRRGAGLGLAIVKGIVEAHGGEAWVESEPGKGATFCFTLARARMEGEG